MHDPRQSPLSESANDLGASTALFADLYELTMARAYFDLGMNDTSVFSLFIRKLPPTRNFFLAAGLGTLLRDLTEYRFNQRALDYLASLDGKFPDPFLKWLEKVRFNGTVRAVPEGTPIFPMEPILEIEAPIGVGQLIETLVMNRIGLETLLASKAARVVTAAEGRMVADFGTRRAQGTDAALRGARAFWIAGAGGTSNVLAGERYGLPVLGTVAHSFIEAFPSESEAFKAFAEIYPGTTLLIDTYDTLVGVRRLVELIHSENLQIGGVRIDSGDLLELSRATRLTLDEAGLTEVKIFVSGGLCERKLSALLAAGAPIDGFGVGTEMSVSSDAPALDIVYKLTSYANEGRMKMAPGKRTLPGPKQVFRRYRDDVAVGDTLTRADETAEGEPLLAAAMVDGAISPTSQLELNQIRDYAAQQIGRLPTAVRSVEEATPYTVDVSPRLAADEAALEQRITERALVE
ncbi:MAG: nicotinate phosphoribosyltransferase [Rhodobacteraceae bacterium]|nr:nicotinate phosphoribosyltransferase [Paracoccaceae bacterium]